MLNPNPSKYSLLEVPKAEVVRTTDAGIFLPGVDLIREMRRNKAKEGLDIMTVENRPDDNYLWGELHHDSSSLGLKTGDHVMFNKFDAEEFFVEDKRYFRILNANALAYFV